MKHSKSTNWKDNPEKILLIDNGAYEIKYSTGNPNSENKLIQNCKFSEKSFNYENNYFIDD